VRSFSEIDTGATFTFSDKEHELAGKLIDELASETFDASKYTDSFSERVKAAVDEKVAGQEITIAPEAPKAQIIDLFEALKKSLADVQEKGGPLAGPKKTEPVASEAPAKKARTKKAQ
jgi:DNA end-binding protein Ku